MSGNLVLSLLASLTIATLATTGLAEPPAATEIVAAADRVRNPQEPFRMSLALVDYVNGKDQGHVNLSVHAKLDEATRQFKNLVYYLGPPRDVGKIVLLNASNMWFYDPASKASIRISQQQRLTGQASNGDVLAVNIARDYTPKLVGEETIQDADRKDRQVWRLDLASATADAMYARLEFWIEQNTHRSVKAKFYSDSGRLLKIAYFRKYEEYLGAARPTEAVIIDAINSNLVTTITYSDIRAEEIPDAWLQREFLPRFAEH